MHIPADPGRMLFLDGHKAASFACQERVAMKILEVAKAFVDACLILVHARNELNCNPLTP